MQSPPLKSRLMKIARNILNGQSTRAQLARFLAMSGTSAMITVGLPTALHEFLNINVQVAVALALTCAFLVNFGTARRIVFRSSGSVKSDFFSFTVSSITFRIMEYAAFLFVNMISSFSYVITLVLILGLSTVSKFIWYRRLFAPKGGAFEVS